MGPRLDLSKHDPSYVQTGARIYHADRLVCANKRDDLLNTDIGCSAHIVEAHLPVALDEPGG
jgi:hypothetical protein